MAGLAARNVVPEIMDDLMLDRPVHDRAMAGLARLNRACFAERLFWEPLRRRFTDGRPVRVLDLACGAGDNILRLALRARKEGLPFAFDGCDFNPQAVAYARKRACRADADTGYFVLDILREPIPEGYDVLLNSLFLHHLNAETLAAFFKKVLASSARMVIMTDLERSRPGLALAYLAAHLLTLSPVVRADGPQSVRAAFRPDEVMRIIKTEGLPEPALDRVWPARYRLVWWRP